MELRCNEMKHHYRIADLVVEMETCGKTATQAKPYLIDNAEKADIVIHSYKDEVKKRYSGIDDDLAEYLGTGVGFYKELLGYDGLMLHSSSVVVDGEAYLFSADPGTGKSTHTALWLKEFPGRAFILNDDKPALRLVNGVWLAYGTPWSGKNDVSKNVGAPVVGIAFLERGEKNSIKPYGGKDAIFDFFKQVNRPRGAEYRAKVLQLLDKLLQSVPVWKLQCNMDPEAAIVSYEAMSGRKFEET